MKTKILLLAFVLTACNVQTGKEANESVPAEFFLGSWALELGYDNNKAGWLEVRQENGYLDAELLWRWGSVNKTEFVFISDGDLFVTQGRDEIRKRDENGKPSSTQHIINWLSIKKIDENNISGMAFFPGDNGIEMEKVPFNGKRIPAPGEKPDLSTASFGEAIDLLEGNDLIAWELLEANASSGWSLKDGVLLNDPVQKEGEKHIPYGNLRTVDTFEDFNLTLEVNVPEGSNSGIYLKGIYEIQVFDSYGKPLDSHNMGALYSRITPSVAAEKPGGEWQELDITLYKRHVTVKLNGITIIDNQAVKGVTGGAITADEFKAGPIYLQGDHGKVAYRNIVIRPVEISNK